MMPESFCFTIEHHEALDEVRRHVLDRDREPVGGVVCSLVLQGDGTWQLCGKWVGQLSFYRAGFAIGQLAKEYDVPAAPGDSDG